MLYNVVAQHTFKVTVVQCLWCSPWIQHCMSFIRRLSYIVWPRKQDVVNRVDRVLVKNKQSSSLLFFILLQVSGEAVESKRCCGFKINCYSAYLNTSTLAAKTLFFDTLFICCFKRVTKCFAQGILVTPLIVVCDLLVYQIWENYVRRQEMWTL